MIKLISYANNKQGYNTKWLIPESELIELNDSALMFNDSLLSFNIKLDENIKEGYNNPVINFVILKSSYEAKCKIYNNYERELFNIVRLRFKEVW